MTSHEHTKTTTNIQLTKHNTNDLWTLPQPPADSAQTMTTGVWWPGRTENGTTQLTKLNKTNITESVHKDKLIVTADMFSSWSPTHCPDWNCGLQSTSKLATTWRGLQWTRTDALHWKTGTDCVSMQNIVRLGVRGHLGYQEIVAVATSPCTFCWSRNVSNRGGLKGSALGWNLMWNNYSSCTQIKVATII